jgi:hypothetical protein
VTRLRDIVSPSLEYGKMYGSHTVTLEWDGVNIILNIISALLSLVREGGVKKERGEAPL